MPVGVQRKRSKGWKMPPNTVSVTRPGKWGNPIEVGTFVFTLGRRMRSAIFPGLGDVCNLTAEQAVQAHWWWLHNTEEGMAVARAAKEELPGKDLACWCPLDAPCHRNNLLKVANE